MTLTRRGLLHLAAGAAALPAVSHTARAQAYPARLIRLVIPFPPGGAFDAVGRPLADRMKPLLGTVVVENIGGGGGSLGVAAVARARPDGYTLVLGGTITHVNEVLLKSHPQYDAVKDLVPVAAVAANVLCIAVQPSVPAKELKEFTAFAKANPGKLSYGHAGVGSIQHLTAGGNARDCAGALSGHWPADHGCPGRTSSNGYAGRDSAGNRAASLRQDADPCRHQSDSSCRGTRHSNRSGTGLPGFNGDRFLGTTRTSRDPVSDHRTDCGRHPDNRS